MPPVRAVARAWASTTPPRVKFTAGRPKPALAKPCPATENAAGGVARSMELGAIPVTHRVHGRVSVKIGRAPCREREADGAVGVWTVTPTGPDERAEGVTRR